jgi:hypothetical protein
MEISSNAKKYQVAHPYHYVVGLESLPSEGGEGEGGAEVMQGRRNWAGHSPLCSTLAPKAASSDESMESTTT